MHRTHLTPPAEPQKTENRHRNDQQSPTESIYSLLPSLFNLGQKWNGWDEQARSVRTCGTDPTVKGFVPFSREETNRLTT